MDVCNDVVVILGQFLVVSYIFVKWYFFNEVYINWILFGKCYYWKDVVDIVVIYYYCIEFGRDFGGQ